MNEVINNKKKSEILSEEIKKLNYGDVIKHSSIAMIIEEEYPSSRYNKTIGQARKILLKHGICLESISGDGYRLVEPDNFVNHSLKRYKRGFNEMQKGYDILANAPTAKMTSEGREVYRRVNDRALVLTAAMKGASVELKTLGQKRHPMQLENIKN